MTADTHYIEAESYLLFLRLEPGIIICLESYVGWYRSSEDVKLVTSN